MIGEKRSTYVRMSDVLYDNIKKIAEIEKRSFNAQCEYFLEKSAYEYLKNSGQTEGQSQ